MTNKEIITNNIKVPNKEMEVLRKHFSHCFDKNGDFQIEKFKQSISENEINFSKESYSMDWLGKSYARLLASDPATTLLKEDKEHNQKPENKQAKNLLLKGDNLEVLKHLSSAYYEEIKMIYIDPPYNTGGDGFVYQDDRKFTVEELQDLAGVDKERAQRILDFTQSKSNSHSAWLTFMYPRLYIAKQLLREDGVVFISIDDNEVAQLRLMMDEIFGEENFVAQIIQNKLNSKNDTINVQKNHEYIICYRKETKYATANKVKASLEKKKLKTKEVFKDGEKYYLINDPITTRGEGGTLNNRNNLGYTVYYNAKTKDFEGVQDYNLEKAKSSNKESEVYQDKNDLISKGYIKIRPPRVRGNLGAWTWELDNFNKNKDNILIQKTKKGYSVRKRTFVSSDKIEIKDKRFYLTYEDISNSRSILDFSTNEGTIQLSQVLGVDGVFNNPKNVNLIKYLIGLIPGKDFIFLDFFAGSGTTGEAVMQLNAKDGGNRNYILVQLPEPIDAKKSKAAYNFVTKELKAEPTIFEITRERLIRAANKTNQELDEKNKELEVTIKSLETELPTEETQEEIKSLKEEIQINKQVQSQNNFKVFETMPIWEDYHFEAKELDEQLELFDETQLTEEDLQALLITWKTYDGIALTEHLQEIYLAGYKAYYAKDKLYLMDKNFTTESLKALLERIDSDKSFNPTSIIVFGYHFESKNLRELAENLKSYSNKKNIDIDFITRY